MENAETRMSDALEAIATQLEGTYSLAVRAEIRELAYSSAEATLSQLMRDMESGQGLIPFTAALERGSIFLNKNCVLLLGEELHPEESAALFGLAFEKAILEHGDPYTPLSLRLTESRLGNLAPPDMDEDGDFNLPFE